MIWALVDEPIVKKAYFSVALTVAQDRPLRY